MNLRFYSPLRYRYMRYLYPYECDRKGLSTPSELQAAIDGNRREGRRSSYGQFDQTMQGQLHQLVNIAIPFVFVLPGNIISWNILFNTIL